MTSQNIALGPESGVFHWQAPRRASHEEDVAATSARKPSPTEVAVRDTKSQADSEDDSTTERAELLFRIDVQRCEGFILALETTLKACKDNGRVDSVRLMARKLEKVIDAMNRS